MAAGPGAESGADRYHDDDPNAYPLPLHTDILAFARRRRTWGLRDEP
jgi:hypothetical protein